MAFARHLGDVDPTQEPYRSEFERDKILVFNLTGLASSGDNAHDRAFEDVTSVMGMIKRRLSDGQVMTERGSGLRPGILYLSLPVSHQNQGDLDVLLNSLKAE